MKGPKEEVVLFLFQTPCFKLLASISFSGGFECFGGETIPIREVLYAIVVPFEWEGKPSLRG